MWRKLLKYRSIAFPFHKVDVRNGYSTSFWFDQWSPLGQLMDIMKTRRVVDMGISVHETLGHVLNSHRRRRHRVEALNKTEDVIRDMSLKRSIGEDRALWRSTNGKFKQRFSTSKTWIQIREAHPQNDWHKRIWFKNATPKFSFIAWLAMYNRLATENRMREWNIGFSGECILCTQHLETRNHLFFTCQYLNYRNRSLRVCFGNTSHQIGTQSRLSFRRKSSHL